VVDEGFATTNLSLEGLREAVGPRVASDLPYNPSHSWLIGDTPTFGQGIALAVTA